MKKLLLLSATLFACTFGRAQSVITTNTSPCNVTLHLRATVNSNGNSVESHMIVIPPGFNGTFDFNTSNWITPPPGPGSFNYYQVDLMNDLSCFAPVFMSPCNGDGTSVNISTLPNSSCYVILGSCNGACPPGTQVSADLILAGSSGGVNDYKLNIHP